METETRRPDEFKKSMGLSLVVHGLVFSLFFIKLVFFSEPMLDLSQAISVNVGDFKESNKLPEKAAAPAEEEAPAPAPKEQEAQEVREPAPEKPAAKVKEKIKAPKPETVNLAKNKNKQKAALEKLKKLSAIEKIKQDLKNESAKGKSKTPAKPRIIAAGTSLGGLDKLQADTYLQAVDGGIKQHWALPQWLINKPLKAKVLVKIDLQGQIISSQVISPSGNSSYDQYCLGAVQKAAPFPAVPEKLSEKFSVDGIIVGFPE